MLGGEKLVDRPEFSPRGAVLAIINNRERGE